MISLNRYAGRFGEYGNLKKLSEGGSSSIVYTAEHRPTKTKVAMKTIYVSLCFSRLLVN